MKREVTREILRGVPIGAEDAARLVLEFIEELGDMGAGVRRGELMQLLRRAMRCGVKQVMKEEETVSFEEAARASVDARKGRRETTVRDLRYFVSRILKVPGVGERPLRAMRSQECRDILQQAFGNSVHSYRKGRAILHSIFAYGLRREWCDNNPVSRIEVPEVKEREIIPLTPAEVRRLERTALRQEYRDMRLPLQLMLYCGVRPAEVARLRPEDIRWQEKELIIRPATSKTGGGRIIPLRHIERQEVLQIAPRNWATRWRALRKSAGFDHWQSDVLRHTFASYHAAFFRDLGALQLEMGHRDSSLLRTRYVSPICYREAAAFWTSNSCVVKP